jgi:hypothetical protein
MFHIQVCPSWDSASILTLHVGTDMTPYRTAGTSLNMYQFTSAVSFSLIHNTENFHLLHLNEMDFLHNFVEIKKQTINSNPTKSSPREMCVNI